MAFRLGTSPKAYDDAAVTAGIAAGVLFVAPDGRVLLLQRAMDEPNYGGFWALPGGKGDDGETAEDAAMRECQEETGMRPSTMKVIDRRVTPNAMGFTTFAAAADKPFAPVLNAEHSGFGWFNIDKIPENIHPSVKATIGDCVIGGDKPAADMSPEEWADLRDGFVKWTREEETETEHADDVKHAKDERFALDSASVRTFDKDGHMHVARTPISKANVCPYYGKEIPNFEALGLEPDKRYMLLRHPEELAKAAVTSNGKPLLIIHTPVDPDDHPYQETVGAVGTDAEYEHPFLFNSLTIWTREGIQGVETEKLRELSSAYRYDADMTPGTYEGVPYDGVMRNIHFNHIAQVEEGRAGADVLVADNAINGEVEMTKISNTVLSRKATLLAGACAAAMVGKLAQDSKFDATAAFSGVSEKNWPEKKVAIITSIKALKFAKDANVDDIVKIIDAVGGMSVAEGADSDPNSGLPMTAEQMATKAKDEDTDKVHSFLKDKGFDEAGCKAFDELMGTLDKTKGAKDEKDDKEEKDEKDDKAKDEADKDDKKDDKKAMDSISKTAFDAAIAKVRTDAAADAVRIANEIVAAKDFVRPWTGALAFDAQCASDVFKVALGKTGIDVKTLAGTTADGMKAILSAMPKPGAAHAQREDFANDSAPAQGTQSRWGDSLNHISIAS